MSIGILGSGAFGTALAIALAKAGREVILWSRDAEFVRELTVTRKNARHLPGAELTMNIRPTADISKLKSCEAILLAVPAQSTSSLLTICAANREVPNPKANPDTFCGSYLNSSSTLR